MVAMARPLGGTAKSLAVFARPAPLARPRRALAKPPQAQQPDKKKTAFKRKKVVAPRGPPEKTRDGADKKGRNYEFLKSIVEARLKQRPKFDAETAARHLAIGREYNVRSRRTRPHQRTRRAQHRPPAVRAQGAAARAPGTRRAVRRHRRAAARPALVDLEPPHPGLRPRGLHRRPGQALAPPVGGALAQRRAAAAASSAESGASSLRGIYPHCWGSSS
mmetsp:Transcript_8399/g.34615  ORF Transcript_8399/g.34615 Transcript_8399/m.34615 type:complete len:219 (-) Transcript_8399:1429-2085(-)